MYEWEIKDLKEKYQEERRILIAEREAEIDEKKEFESKFDDCNDNFTSLQYDYNCLLESSEKDKKDLEDRVSDLASQLASIKQNQQVEIGRNVEEWKELLRSEIEKKNSEISCLKEDSETNFANYQSKVDEEK